jgi:hypothetical protein
MKSLLLFVCTLFAVVLCWQSCRSTRDAQTIVPACPACIDYSGKPMQGISIVTAKELADSFYTNHYARYGRDANDARCIWFSLDSLKKFIWTIENAVCKSGCTDNLNLGVRIYYSTYPAAVGNGADGIRNEDFSGIDPGFSSKHTLFMMPTFETGGIHYDFNTEMPFKGGCVPQALDPTLVERIKNAQASGEKLFQSANRMGILSTTAVSSAYGNLLNHGSLFPPKRITGIAFF